MSVLYAGPVSAAERFETAALTPGTPIEREALLPTIIGAGDLAHYRAIYAFQDEGRWAAADREMAALENRLLLGHMLAQRYLHLGYKASYAELQDWLAHYADLPQATAIHALAAARHTRGTKPVPAPEGAPVALGGIPDDPADLRPPGHVARTPRAAAIKLEIRHLSRKDPTAADQLLARADDARLFDDSDYDEARADVAEGYLFVGDDQRALALAAAARSAAWRPLAHWDAGLAAWRLGRLGDARSHFEALARAPNLSRWNRSAAAFWAARVHARSSRPDLTDYWLRIAAEEPRTFYGLLARRVLGLNTYFNFEPEIFTNIDLDAIAGVPAARRALALMQLGWYRPAELELRILANEAEPTLYPALVALAERCNMPALSVQLASMLSEVDGRRHDNALFPVPRWRPRGGFTIDRALLFALIRQESHFMPEAQSGAGAIGLMQLMPGTAAGMAERLGIALKGRGWNTDSVIDPEVNLALGQEFLGLVLENEQIKGNLILFAAAYNSGPAAALRWRARSEYGNDPLLFVESMPSRETRVFVQRVLTNYWVYRLRLGQPTRDLDMLARGAWPVYVGLDVRGKEVVSNDSDR